MISFFAHMKDLLRKCFSGSSQRSIAGAALVVAFFGVASRILGVVRDRILAAQFGAGDVLDTYYAAFRLPDTLFELVVAGALGAAFIPIFSGLLVADEKERAWRAAQGVLLAVIGTVGIIAVALWICAPLFVRGIVPGFDTEKLTTTITLTRIMLLSPILLSVSAVLGGVLVSFQRFIYNAAAPILYNIGIMIGAKVFVPLIGTTGLAWGVVCGAVLHACMHLIDVHRIGFRLRNVRITDVSHNRDVIKTMTLMVPRMFSSASNQVSLLLVTFFASTLAAGSITIFTFANNVQSVVLGLFGIPFAVAAFPVLSGAFASGDAEGFGDVLSRTLRRILYYAVPLSAIFFVLREQIVRIVYGAGHFSLADTQTTYQVLGIMCVSLFAQSIIPLLARGFYAMYNTKTPFYIALASQTINVLIIMALIRQWEIYAIAFAFTITSIMNASLLFGYLHRSISDDQYRTTLRAILQIATATIGVIIVTVFTRNFLGEVLPRQYVLGVFGQLVGAGIVGIGAYLFVTGIFGMREFETVRKKIIIRIFSKPDVASEAQKISVAQ